MKRATILLSLVLSLATGPESGFALPVFPGACGCGSDTAAGRGGTIIRVTTLSDSGPGSLRAALEVSGPRIVIFEISGTIVLAEDIDMRHPYVTVAGQTAPAPGITIRGAAIRIVTHDVLIQHLRFRTGDRSGGPPYDNRDALGVESQAASGDEEAFNVVIDHCSFSWGVDENVAFFWPEVHDITISNSIMSEALNSPLHPKGPYHSMGLLVGDGINDVTIAYNLFASNRNRNPRLKGGTTSAVINNLMYNSGGPNVHIGDYEGTGGAIFASVVGNLAIPGPDSPNTADYTVLLDDENIAGTKTMLNSRVYVSDNACEAGGNCVENRVGSGAILVGSPPSQAPLPVGCEIYPSGQVMNRVLSQAGARPGDWDPVDLRVLSDVSTRGGRLISSQDDVGGWPNLPVVRRELTLPSDPHGDSDGDGYTNVEEWIHSFSDFSSDPAALPPGRLRIR